MRYLDLYMKNGEDHKNWYENEPALLIDLLPEFKGLPIVEFFAVTSMTTSIEANVHLAIKALLQLKNNEKFNGFLPTQINYLNKVVNDDFIKGRKIRNFVNALKGNANAVVVDIWMCFAFNMAKRRKFKGRNYWLAPTKKEYDFIENKCIEKATLLEIEPRQFQSMVWCGVKQTFSKSKNVSWTDLIKQKRGIFPFC